MTTTTGYRIQICLALSLCMLPCGCDVQKIGNRISAADDVSPSGTAQGGLSYTPASSDKQWSQTFFICHGSTTDAGMTTVRAGSNGGNLPLTVIADKMEIRSLELKSPQGAIVFAPENCSHLTLNRASPNGLRDAGGTITGKVAFQCVKDGKSLTGAVVFNQCGR